MDKTIIITGGNGFIGSHIVREFKSHGYSPVCLVRPGSDCSALRDLDVKIIPGDVTDFQSLIKAFEGAGCIIHNAAFASDWGDYDLFYRVNVGGAVNVMKACTELGIRRVILTGTCSVYGEEDYPGVKDENHGFHSHYPYFLGSLFPCAFNFYRDTKTLSQENVIAMAQEKGVDVTILNPVWVYGEREFHTGFYEFVQNALNGMPLAPGSGKNKFHVVYAGDLARAFRIAYEKNLRGINSFIIGSREVDTMDRIFGLFCREAGARKPVNAPKWLMYPIGFMLEFFATLLRLKKAPPLTRGRVNVFYDNIEYSTRKAREILGFESTTTLEAGIKKTIAWYKQNGLLKERAR